MSLDYVELVMEIQSEFGVNIADSDATKITTVGALFDVIAELLPTEAGADLSSRAQRGISPFGYSGELWERYVALIQQRTDISRDRLVPSARFVQDLGLD